MASRRYCLLASLLGVVLGNTTSAAEVSYVIQLSLDGLGAKYLEFYVTNAPAQFPNFVRLQTEGAFTYNARCDYNVSETVANHACIFTGRPVRQPAGFPNTTHHGYTNNSPAPSDTFHNSGNTNVPYKASMFDVAHDHGFSTAFYASKTRLTICDRSYNATNGAPDLLGDDDGMDKIDLAVINDGPVPALFDRLTENLTNNPPRYTFLHSMEPDVTGHSQNWGSAGWSNSVRMVDEQIGRVFAAIAASPTLSNHTALVITADHGGGGVTRNGHTEPYHITNYTIPFFVLGPGIPAGADLYSLFANRADPGPNYVDNTLVPQPIRDGDAGNISLALLGLPPITGSFMIPIFGTPIKSLAISRKGALYLVSWAAAPNDYQLEFTENLPGSEWQAITEGILKDGTTNSYRVIIETNVSRFYRLRKL